MGDDARMNTSSRSDVSPMDVQRAIEVVLDDSPDSTELFAALCLLEQTPEAKMTETVRRAGLQVLQQKLRAVLVAQLLTRRDHGR